jgi:hypothetical protein
MIQAPLMTIKEAISAYMHLFIHLSPLKQMTMKATEILVMAVQNVKGKNARFENLRALTRWTLLR